MRTTEVDLQLCYESPGSRPIRSEAVDALAESIRECGLLQSIVVRAVEKSRAGQMTAAFEVIAGMHRVKACRRLGWSTITASVIEVDDLHAELMLIDENLCRNDLSPAERSAAQARRKAIYQELHPETRSVTERGGPGRGHKNDGQVGQRLETPRFDEAAAHATGQSERAVRRDVHRGEALGGAALAKVARTSLDKGEELDALAKCTPEKRSELIERAAKGETVSAKHELRRLPRRSADSGHIQEECSDCKTQEQRWQWSMSNLAGDAISMCAFWTREFGKWEKFEAPSSLVTLAKQAAKAWTKLATDRGWAPVSADHSDEETEEQAGEDEAGAGAKKSRPARWTAAVASALAALQDLVDLQQDYESWRDSLPENLQSGALFEKLEAVIELDVPAAIEAVSEFEGVDLPLGFGRD